MSYIENFNLSGGKRRSRKVRSNAGKNRGPYGPRKVPRKVSRKVSRKRRSNAGKSRAPYRVRSDTSGKLRKKRSNSGKKRKSKGWFW